jgi:hypothetical protein
MLPGQQIKPHDFQTMTNKPVGQTPAIGDFAVVISID